MAIPTVFISSTFYDLRYMRESVKRFVEQLGYTPVLSEAGTVFYDPAVKAAEACLAEVSNADILVLLIGGRYGSAMPSGRSVTNSEYQRARQDRIPVFALVEQSTYNDYLLFKRNSHNRAVVEQITFPSADDIRIFEFIEDVEGSAENNALVPFQTLGDVESYLRSQWAGLMFNSLSSSAREARVEDTLGALKQINERVEAIASQILRLVGEPADRVYIKMLQDSQYIKAKDELEFYREPLLFTDIVIYPDLRAWVESKGLQLDVVEDLPEMSDPAAPGYRRIAGSFDAHGGRHYLAAEDGTDIVLVQPGAYDRDNRIYRVARAALTQVLEASGVTLEQLTSYAATLDLN